MSKLQEDINSINKKININGTTLKMVGKICTVCKRCSLIDKSLTYFSYPEDPIRRFEWLKAVKRLDLMQKLDDDKTRDNHRICELHFESRFIQKFRVCEGRKFLTKDAFPTLCLSTFNRGLPIKTENFLTSRKPIPIMNAPLPMIVKKSEELNKFDNRSKEEPVVSRYNLRPIKVKSQQEEDSEDEDDVDDLQNKVAYEGNTKSKQHSSSALFCNDASLFCESVMRVSQSTQTNVLQGQDSILKSTSQTKIAGQVTNTYQEFVKNCSRFLSPTLCRLIKLKTCSVEGKQANFVLFAFNLYYSTNLYNFLSNMLSLPPPDALKYYLLPKTTKINEQFLNAFRCKIKNMSAKEKVCCFSVGTISLKPSLYYDIKCDRVIGFHDINGVQNTNIAKYAILLMVQGLLVNWKQPISYAFISGYDNIPEISMWIDEVLTSLIEIGLDIRIFVSDPRSEFLYASDTRLVTPEKTNFTINRTDIFYTYDATQLLKIVKNNLKSCDFHYGPDFQNSNNEHFFDKITDLCNLLNAQSPYSNSRYKRAFSNKKYQTSFLSQMLELFQNLKVMRKADGTDVTENMKFIESFQISIKSVQQLFDQLQILGVKYLDTSQLTHKPLNSFFAQLKGMDSKNECTPKQFNKAFVRRCVFSILRKPVNYDKLGSLDAEEHARKLLDVKIKEIQSISNEPLFINTTDYRNNLPDKNVFVYICRYCFLKCTQIHKCGTFQNYVRKINQDKGDEAYFCSVSQLDLNVQNSKILPPDDFTEYLLHLEYKYNDFFKTNTQITSIGQEIFKELEECEYDMPCPCFPIDYLRSLFVRLRLFYSIRKNNRLIKKKKGVKTFRVCSL